MRVGRLRHVLQIKKYSKVKDQYGAKSKELVTVIPDVRGNVQVISGVEKIKANVVVTDVILSILVRYDPRITEELFVTWKGMDYSIESVKPDDRNRDMIITAMIEV